MTLDPHDRGDGPSPDDPVQHGHPEPSPDALPTGPASGANGCGECVTDHAARARAEARALVQRIERDYGRLAPVLSEIRANAYFALWGYESYAAYVEEEFHWRARKGDYIASIGGLIGSGCISPESVQRLGWSKVAALSSLPDDQLHGPQLGSWLTSAEGTGIRALKGRIRDARNGARATGEAAPKIFTPFTVRLAPGQMERVQLAMGIAGKMDGSDKRCHLLDIIAADFIAGRHKEIGLKLQTILMSLEAAFEVEILAMRIKGARRECIFASNGLRDYLSADGQGA